VATQLTTADLETPPGHQTVPSPSTDQPVPTERSRRAANAGFGVFFVGYLGFAVFVLSLGVVAWLAGSHPGLHDKLHIWGTSNSLWGRASLRMANASHTRESLGQFALDYGFSLLNLGLAIFLVWLRPRDRTARLLAIGLVGTAAVFNLQAHAVYEALGSPTSTLENVSHELYHVIAGVSYVLALLLFPDGQAIPRWKRPSLVALYAGVSALIGLGAVTVTHGSRTVTLILFFGLVTPLVGVIGQAYRFRTASSPAVRQQSRLLFAVLAPAFLVGVYAVTVGLQSSVTSGLQGRNLLVLPVTVFRVFLPVFSIIPIALVAGIVRYRLWDIDRVINRAVLYGLLAGFVTAVYVGVVVGVGRLIGIQQSGNIALSVVATGIIAVAFQPVKDRVQRFANRLVYGHRATPYEVLSEFSERVADTAATDDLLDRMARILAEGTGARWVNVWLKVGRELRPAAAWPVDEANSPDAIVLDDDETFPSFRDVTACVPVRHHGELFGALTVTKPGSEQLTPTEDRLLSDLGRQAGLVLRNVQLTAELRARLEELQASRVRLLSAQDEARRRLERNLHDGAQQQLVAMKVHLSLAEGVASKMPEADMLAEMLRDLKEQADDAVNTLRDLAHGIYPPLLAAEGLPVALAAQARKSTLPIEVDAEGIGRFEQEREAAVYFCTLEALQNAAKYSEATKVVVQLRHDDDNLFVIVRDDGKGFDPADFVAGAGTQNMSDRFETLGGHLEITSAPGAGTTVSGTLPLH
jgi:signal transduction histidine kinase